MKVARNVLVTGRVQGVFFRAWTKEQADRLEVRGWIRNCRDGSVEAHLEGAEQSVDQLLGLLHEGPHGAHVDNLEISKAPLENTDWFSVRR